MSTTTFKSIFALVLLIVTTILAQSENQSKHRIIIDSAELNGDDACLTVQNGVEVKGSCMTIVKCPSILANVIKRINDHDVCGYEGVTQIVCCPVPNNNIEIPVKINLNENLECRLADTNNLGIIKFLSDCPAFSSNIAAAQTNKICDYEICSDLVCCPVTPLKTRLKNVCSMVDAPVDQLELRLLQNQECTIKELNLRGVYQRTCDFADRNPQLKSILQNVCNDDFVCKGWYCCPIEYDDQFYCTASKISRPLATLVGPKCVDTQSGRQGTCKQGPDCLEVNDYWTLDTCGSYCCSNFYCCPDTDSPVNQPISVRECTSYTKYLTKKEILVTMDAYGNKTACGGGGYAAGGIIVSPGDFPHMAALGYESDQKIVWNCGGSLISNRYVLTAAHCLSNRNIGDVKKVRLGVIDLLNDVNTADCPEEFDVAKIIPYPEYDPKFVYNDIGLIELVGRVNYNFHIRPICLPASSDLPSSYESMGWGALSAIEAQSVKLIKVYQDLFSFEECQELYQFNLNRRLHKGILNDTHICAGSKISIQSTCQGDSGGPLLARHKTYYKLFYLYGVVSFGTACGFANSPGVYTKVFPYVKWIETVVWSN